MRPFGGIVLTVHLIIIVIKWVKTNPLPTLIITLVFLLVFVGAGASITQSFSGSSNVDFIADLFYQCKPIENASNSKDVVILRLDDVQAYTWANISMKIIDDAFTRNAPLVVGVIPKGLEEDKEMVRFLEKNSCNLEIALHGYNHRQDVPEFGAISEREARKKIEKGKTILEELTNEPIVTFIPPNNAYSIAAGLALMKSGFKTISSGGGGGLDFTASTYDFGTNELIPVKDVVDKCEKAFDRNKPCVIMLHPQDYATNGLLDEAKYSNYLMLLDELKRRNVFFTTMRDYVR